jgi:hypothetical protein
MSAANTPRAPAPKPKLNAPVVARSGAETMAAMDQVNSQPLPLDLLRAESWHGIGGSAGFSWDGQDI